MQRPLALELEKALRVSAWLACAMVLGMIAIFFATGVGQDPLQFVHPPADYARLLLANPPALKACLALDNLFIVFYATLFVCLGVLLVRGGAVRALVLASIGLLGALALLDLIENLHFLVMLARAQEGLFPSATEIELQVFESLLKFHVSYLALFLLGFALPRRTRQERLLAGLSWFVQLPVGILIYVTPPQLSFPLVFVRFTYFVAALLLVASIFGAGSDAPASRPGTTPAAAG